MRRLALLLLIMIAPLKGEEEVSAELVQGFNQTGLFFYYLIDKSQNTLISPLAINTSLLMAYMGAREQTATEIAQALHLKSAQDQVGSAYHDLYNYLTRSGGKLTIGSSMWLADGTTILPPYKKTLSENFGSEIRTVDFSKPQKATDLINEWVFDQSQHKITSLISPEALSPATKMLLINGLFLEGVWKIPFPTQHSSTQPFNIAATKSVNAHLMNNRGDYLYYENDSSQVLALQIEGKNSNLAFVIFLPKEIKYSNLYDFYYSLEQADPEGFLTYLNRFEMQDVDITLPKFRVSQKLNLMPLFTSLGIRAALSDRANFSGINGKQNLHISNAIHEGILAIDEEGIFATASAGTIFSLKSSEEQEKPIVMNVNHPFLYAVVDLETKLLLFLGECLNPTVSDITQTGGPQS